MTKLILSSKASTRLFCRWTFSKKMFRASQWIFEKVEQAKKHQYSAWQELAQRTWVWKLLNILTFHTVHNTKNLRYFLLLFYLFRQIFCQNYQLVFFYQYFKWPIIYSLYKGVQHSTNRFFSLQGKSLRESVENAFNIGSYNFSECFLHFCQLNFFP